MSLKICIQIEVLNLKMLKKGTKYFNAKNFNSLDHQFYLPTLFHGFESFKFLLRMFVRPLV